MGPILLIWKVGLICDLIKATFVWNVNNKSFQNLYVLLLLFGTNLCHLLHLLGSIFLGKTKIVEKEACYIDLNGALI